MALHLGLSNHNRLVFQAACGVAADPVLQTYATAALPASALSDAQAKAIWNTYQDFLKQWVFSPVFLALFTLPYKTALTLSAELEPVWTRFLAELSSLVRLVEQAWKPPAGYRFLRFWLSRVHEAKCWPPGEEYRRLQNACAACWQYDNPDSNRVLTYADYCGSIQAGQFIRQSAAELYFPVSGSMWSGPVDDSRHLDWLDRQLYDRMASCVASAQGHPKGELLVRSCREPDSLTEDDIVTLLRFLRFYSGVHFMGHLGELIGLPLVIRTLRSHLPPTATCIPGSSIRIRTDRGWQQGPDAVLANVQLQGTTADVEVLGLVEVKAYRRSVRALKDQIQKHRRRWIDGEVRLLGEEPNATARWLPWWSLSKNPNRHEFTVTNSTWPDRVREIGVVPAHRRRAAKAGADDLLCVPMPWQPAGFRSMGLYFCLWLIENFGRVLDPDDYDLGPLGWQSFLMRFLNANGPAQRIEKSTARSLLAVIESRGENPDQHWVT
ncbi:MAG: hypothetical protein KJ000_23625 [Pirellulaceae bacterium]|nr:hypothetical protein [Pirellulaceae bacterium]